MINLKKSIQFPVIVISVLLFFGAVVFAAHAADPLPFQTGSGLGFSVGDVTADTLGNYMTALLQFFLRLAVILGVLMVTIGGFQWMVALGDSGKITNAKGTIHDAVVGLILAATSVLIFSQIDTSFVNLKSPTLTGVDINAKECTTWLNEYVCPAPKCHWDASGNGGKGVCAEGVAPIPNAGNPGVVGLTQCGDPYYGNGCSESQGVNQVRRCMLTAESNSKGALVLGSIYTYNGTHSVYSCHFGGRTCKDGAHAIDFGGGYGVFSSAAVANAIINAAQTCGQQNNATITCRCEDSNGKTISSCTNPADHVHCSINNANCGCN